MKKVILPKLAFLSVSILLTINGYSQENKNGFSTDVKDVKSFIKSDAGAKNNSDIIHSPDKILRIAKYPEEKGISAGSNLIPYKPTGWDEQIVLSTVSGTTTSASSFNNGQTIYLDFAIANNGTSDITQKFSVKLYIDDVFSDAVDVDGLRYGYYVYATDWEYFPLSPGTHTFKIVADADNAIAETNEADNEYSRTITVSSTIPCNNIITFLPEEWDNMLILSTVAGTTTSAAHIYSNQIIYADWAIASVGGCGVSETFNVSILVDGVVKNTYVVAGLGYRVSLSVFDRQIGPFAAGLHTFKVVSDVNNAANEINETDNEYTRTFTVESQPTGIESFENSAAIKTYPNPVSNELVIEFQGNVEKVKFEILNSAGQKVYNSELFEKTIVPTSTFAPGIYLIKFNGEKISGIKKVIIK
jgi:hypothetical protein